MKPTKINLLKNRDNTKIKQIKGLVLSSDGLNDTTTAFTGKTSWEKTKNTGCHYSMDASSLVQYVKEDEICNHVENNKTTYISNSLYEGKPNEYTVGLLLCVTKSVDYTTTEKKAIKFCAEFLKEHKLTIDNLWREFDLNKKPSPAQYLDKKRWHKFVDEVKQYMEKSKDKDFNEKTYVIQTPFINNDELKKYIAINKNNIVAIADKLQPDDRGIGDLATKRGMAVNGDPKTIDTKHGNIVTYTVSQMAPGSNSTDDTATTDTSEGMSNESVEIDTSSGGDSCITPVDEAAVKVNPKECKVDPVYPDTIVPPGTSTSFFNSKDDSKANTDKTTIPSVEEYKKRQQIFDPKKHADAIKEERGKPVNNNDPYPIDKKIEELQHHNPKVKIDETNFKLGSCNHPGCEVASTLINLSSMINDAMVDQSKRIEQRLVLLENTMATITRYLFRMSSRVNINCVYYGGQDIFGKYKCIRCLHPDRINDGQSMTMDQCLNCSRYEPIIGQIYDILDDSGMNLSAILDDNQMSYMGMSDHINLNRVEEFHNESANYSFKNTIKNNNTFETKKEEAKKKVEQEKENLKKKKEKEVIDNKKKENDKINKSQKDTDKDGHDAESQKPKISAKDQLIIVDEDKIYRDIDKNVPKQFNTIWPKGFVMDWNKTDLESQSTNVNDYKYEKINKYNEEKFEDGFKDTRKDANDYEHLEYTSDEFNIEFGNNTNSGMTGDIGFGNGSAIREKILARAKAIVDLCSQGKAYYSHARPYGKIGNDKYSWDCSAFTHDCYKTAGITLTCPHTTEQFTQCHPKNGGVLYKIQNSIVPKEALPGDIIFFAGNGKPSDPLSFNTAGAITHVGIYAGDNMMYHSGHHHSDDSKKDIVKIKVYNAAIAVGRPKALIEADKQASTSCNISLPGNVPDDLKKAGEAVKGNASTTIKNLNKYNYKKDLIAAANKYNVDPYLVLAIICVESTGNPHCGGGTYVGLMQTQGGNTGNIYNDICKGLNEYNNKKNVMKKMFGINSDMLAIYAYNGGEGTVKGAIGLGKLNAKTINGIQLAPWIKQYVYNAVSSGKYHWGNAKAQSDEKYKYYARVMYAYNFLKQAKALN